MLQSGDHPTPLDAAARARLEADGCVFHEQPNQSATLQHAGLGVWRDYLEHDAHLARRVEVYQQTQSTQDAARRLIQAGSEAHRAVVLADQQTAGRGRLGRSWIAPPGRCVLMSVVHRAPSTADRTTFAASVAVADALASLMPNTPAAPVIKWPNDITLNRRKLAGILVETFDHDGQRFHVIGIGVNVSLTREDLPPELIEHATSPTMLGQPIHRLAVAEGILKQLDQTLYHTPEQDLLHRWRSRCDMLQAQRAFVCEGKTVQGTVIDIDPDAGLIVRTAHGTLMHLPAMSTASADLPNA